MILDRRRRDGRRPGRPEARGRRRRAFRSRLGRDPADPLRPGGPRHGRLRDIVEANQVIGMEENCRGRAELSSSDSSLVAACRAVGEVEAEAVVSVGTLARCSRPAPRAAPAPGSRAPGDRRGRDPGQARPLGVLIDSGATTPTRGRSTAPKSSDMGSVSSPRTFWRCATPDGGCCLLGIGEEPEKGNQSRSRRTQSRPCRGPPLLGGNTERAATSSPLAGGRRQRPRRPPPATSFSRS